jgi:hypothetical protein
MFCTAVCSAETVCAVWLIAPATTVKFALTSAAFAGVPATKMFGTVTGPDESPADALVAASVSIAARAAASCEYCIGGFNP